MTFLSQLFRRGPSQAQLALWARSQHGEDRYILDLLSGRGDKVVVDVGANDGESWSNSYLYGRLGYRLILVEPMPAYARKCRELWAGNPKVVVEESAVSTTAGEAAFFVNLDTDSDLLAMRSSLGKTNVPGGRVEEIKVRVERLDAILERVRCPADYALLSVDAEGFDLQVLESAGLDRFRPEIICVEDQVDFSGAISRTLADKGYDPVARLGANGLYRRRGMGSAPIYFHEGGLWVDRADAPKEIARRDAAGLLTQASAADLSTFSERGYLVLKGVVDERLLQSLEAEAAGGTDPHARSVVARTVLSHSRLTGALSAVFGVEPLLFASRRVEGAETDRREAATGAVAEPFKQAAAFVVLQPGLALSPGSHRSDRGHPKPLNVGRGDIVLCHANLAWRPSGRGLLGHFCALGVSPTYFFLGEGRWTHDRHAGLVYSSPVSSD